MIFIRVLFLAVVFVTLAQMTYAESWIDFHTEKWSRKSGKSGRKLLFSNHYFYDAESIKRSSSGDVTLWIKVISDNDKYYVKKGAPQSETVYRNVHLWCSLKRYEVIQIDTDTDGANELLSEEIKNGSYYEGLFNAVCSVKAQ